MDGSPVEMRLVEGGLLVEPASTRPLSLEELLDGVSESNLHGEVDTGPAQGLEVW
jgi:antitoxin MazE